jgi:putative addiction module component (TIGR02574 family)
MDADQLLREAMRLSPEDRAKLAGKLISSLDDSVPDSDRDVLWAAEIRRRIDEYDAGLVTAVPGDQLLADLKAIASGRRS